jgi:hypothetical protein
MLQQSGGGGYKTQVAAGHQVTWSKFQMAFRAERMLMLPRGGRVHRQTLKITSQKQTYQRLRKLLDPIS